MRIITIKDIGEALLRLYESEIDFRFETNWDEGYTWCLLGNEGDPQPGEIQWKRVEIDDAIDGTPFAHGDQDLKSIHFMKRDWIKRGADLNIEVAIRELCEAACERHPGCDFANWYLESNEQDPGWRFLWPLRRAEELIKQLPEHVSARNEWLQRYGTPASE